MSEKDINPNGSYYCVYDWMTKKAKLKGSKLQVFAVIYGFSCSDAKSFSGSIDYLSNFTGIGRSAVCEALKKLTQNNIIIKHNIKKGGRIFCEYTVNRKFIDEFCHTEKETDKMQSEHSVFDAEHSVNGTQTTKTDSPENGLDRYKNRTGTVRKSDEYSPKSECDRSEIRMGTVQNPDGYSPEIRHNNIVDNIVDTIDDNIGIYAHTTAQGQNNKKRFIPPKTEEVQSYCKQRNSSVDPERFVDFYTSKGWRIGNQPMRDWKAALRTWERNERNTVPKERIGKNGIRMTAERSTDLDGVF